MADITMCTGVDCPRKNQCYRFTASKGVYQSYFLNVVYDKIKDSCDEYWPNKQIPEL